METTRTFRLLVSCLLTVLLISCGLISSPESAIPTSTPAQPGSPSRTPTPTAIPGVNPATPPPPEQLTGNLEIRFPDPWERPEFCTADIPFVLTLQGEAYKLTGEGIFDCHQIMTFEEGLKQHLEQNYAVTLTGSMPTNPGGILTMTVAMEGYQDGYFSDYPHGAPEIITETNPFHVDIDQPLDLNFSYEEGAFCVWNQAGVFTSLPGEEPPLGENGWLFILHPEQ